MTRREDWPQRLAEAVLAARGRAFEWAVHDCLAFANGTARAMCGTGPFDDVFARYKSAAGARRGMVRHGLETVEDVVSARLPEIPPAMAGRGDWISVETGDGGIGIAVVTGEFAAMPLDTGGVIDVPVSQARKGWLVE